MHTLTSTISNSRRSQAKVMSQIRMTNSELFTLFDCWKKTKLSHDNENKIDEIDKCTTSVSFVLVKKCNGNDSRRRVQTHFLK